MARLPNPGGDDGAWGGILNDFLTVGHATDGTHVDASTTVKGFVQLAGDLAGTAAAPTVPALASKETPAGAQAKVDAHNADPSAHGGQAISRGVTMLDPVAANLVIWRATAGCTVTQISGYRVGGTGATINARKNGTALLASDVSMSTEGNWVSSSAIQNQGVVAGDTIEVAISAVTGAPSQVAIQIEFITT